MPIDERRRDAIAAAVAAYDRTNPKARLPRTAAWLLAAMFPSEDVCQKSQDDIAAEGFSRDSMPGVLRRSSARMDGLSIESWGRCATILGTS